ncbi:MAG: hypothetical protein JO107_01170, partial [Hyphomicrobiales bacterium]|nr:hypothetical protein [Hyphomicrobiales bacterium]MBV8661688.1 hypothetical protein [Hyphomicrobiales bacterium]
MSGVIVHRIKFDLKVGSRPQALRVQEVASRFAAESLPEILERGLANLTADDRHLALDRLDLKLGVLDERAFATELPARTARALADALFAARYGRTAGSSTPVLDRPIAVRRRERLATFLEYGLFDKPTDPQEPATPGALLEALIDSDADIVPWLAALAGDRPQVLSRLARQIGDEALARLLHAVAPNADEAAQTFLIALQRRPAAGPGRAMAKRDAVWEAILQTALQPQTNEADLISALARATRTLAEPGSGGLSASATAATPSATMPQLPAAIIGSVRGSAATFGGPSPSVADIASSAARSADISAAELRTSEPAKQNQDESPDAGATAAAPSASTPPPRISGPTAENSRGDGNAKLHAFGAAPADLSASTAMPANSLAAEPQAPATRGPAGTNPEREPSAGILPATHAGGALASSPTFSMEAAEGDR